MTMWASVAGLGARRLGTVERNVRELQRIGPQPYLYVGDYPSEPFTRPESPTWQNSHTFLPGYRVKIRWGMDGTPEIEGAFDLTAGAVTGTVAFNVNENTDEYEGVGFVAFIPLELDDGVWSAAVVRMYEEATGGFAAGDVVVYWPIVADPIP